jgi:hypothetical protein
MCASEREIINKSKNGNPSEYMRGFWISSGRNYLSYVFGEVPLYFTSV